MLKVVLVSRGSIINMIDQVNYIHSMKKTFGSDIEYLCQLENYSEERASLLRSMNLFSCISKIDEDMDGDLVIDIRLLPVFRKISNAFQKSDYYQILKPEIDAWEELLCNEGTRKFFADSKYFDSNAIEYFLLRGFNHFNYLDIKNIFNMDQENYGFDSSQRKENANLKNEIYLAIAVLDSTNRVGEWAENRWDKLITKLKESYSGIKVCQLSDGKLPKIPRVDSYINVNDYEAVKSALSNANIYIGCSNELLFVRAMLSNKRNIALYGPFPQDFYCIKGIRIKDSQCPHWCMEMSDTWDRYCLNKLSPNCCMDNINSETVFHAIEDYLSDM